MPLALVVVSNVVYQIFAKSVPENMNPLASLTVSYLVGALASGILYYVTMGKNAALLKEYAKCNWVPFALGIAIVGLEVGYIYAYRAGWPVSEAQITQASVLAVVLIFIGNFLYQEPITRNKVLGILICLAGLFLIGKK